MAILINDNYSLSAIKPFDARYLNISTPWADCAAALAGIPTYRYSGLTVNIAGDEWWWKDGVGDGDLVLKTQGGSGTLSGATNGLQLFCGNTNVGLGGALTQNTTICGGYGLGLGDIASGLTSISAVTSIFQIYDTGINSSLSFCHNQDTPHFDVCLYGENADSNADIVLDVDISQGCFSVNTAPNTTCCSALSLKTTDSNVAIYNAHSTNNVMNYVSEACIASSKLICESLTDSGNAALNIKSVMDYDTRSWEFCKDNATILTILSGGTARYGSNVTLTNDCDLAHKWYVDNATGTLSGANGLSKDGDNIVLGGALTGVTTINVSGQQLTFTGGTVNISNATLQICGSQTVIENSSVSAIGVDNGANCACIGISTGGFNIVDSFANTGFKYLNNYCAAGKTNPRWIPDNAYVTGLTSTSGVQSANNGITKEGTNVRLGGTLTGNTTIAGGSNSMLFNGLQTFGVTGVSTSICGTTNIALRTPSFTLHNGVGNVLTFDTSCNKITDIVNSEGLVYASNYCAIGQFNPRWIPDAAYVTGLTSGFLNTASNGLTESGQDVKLGGTLTEATNICLGGGGASQTFKVINSGTTTCTILDVNPTIVQICASNVNSPFQTGRVAVATSAALICHGFPTCYSCLNMSNSLVNLTFCGGSSNASFTVDDKSSTPRGIEYAADYSNTFSDESLITKRYVSGVTSGITANAITGATNGLCKVGQDVVLGGTLTGDTNIDSGTYNFKVCSTASGTKQISLTDGSSIIASYANVSGCTGRLQLTDSSASLTSQNNTCVAGISMQHATNTIAFNAAGNSKTCHTTTGFVYCGNYCATEKTNPRWIPDNQYVTGLTSTSGLQTASNGLCKNGTDVLLGGNLTEWTTITPTGSSLGMDIGSVGSELDTFQVGTFNLQLHNNCGGICFISGNGSAPYYSVQGYDSSDHYIYNEICTATGNLYEEFGTATNRCRTIAYDLCGTTAFEEQLYNTGAMYWKCVDLNENLGTLVAVHERISQTGTLTNNIATSMCYVDRSWKLCIDNAVHFSILSGGTARYASNVTLANDCDLAHKWYVDSVTSGITSCAITTANNGLTKVGQNVVLGGNLTGDTAIGGAHTMAFNNTAFNVSATDIGLTGNTTIDGEFKLSTGASVTFIETTLTNDDTRLPTSGAVYDAISTANVNAGNGLTATGTYVELGGILTGATTISGGSQTLRLGHSLSCLSNFYVDASSAVQIQSSTLTFNSLSSALYKAGNFCMQLDNTNATFCDNSGGKDGLKYASCISTGFTNTCSLVDKGYVDSSNTVGSVCNVTTNYTATQTDDFIGVSGATQISLPNPPKARQRITVADICGNALNANVCVIGNGLCISGNAIATINTNYGSMTFINNGYSWSAVAFIN